MNVGDNYVQIDPEDVIHIEQIDVPEVGHEDGFLFKALLVPNKDENGRLTHTYVIPYHMLQEFVENAVAVLAFEDALDLPAIVKASRDGDRASR